MIEVSSDARPTLNHVSTGATTVQPKVTAFFDEATNTVSHVVSEPASGACAIIDSVFDFDQGSGRTATHNADQIIAFVHEREFETQWLLETHVHADHLSAAPYLREQLGWYIAIGAGITAVQGVFAEIFNEGERFACDGRQFDRLFKEADRFAIGAMTVRAMQTPGLTPAAITYVIEDAAFVGDTLFMPDFGTARCDFPGGSAASCGTRSKNP
jgi:glyoxylase-like metal-dependent hydrolase (beta-lactamase superfamily II)